MTKAAKHPGSPRRSPCPLACALDLIGDKWSLLVIRDLLLGRKTYGELQASPEHIPTNILADRLKRLEAAELIAAEPYQDRPVRYAYSLTARGAGLKDVLLAVAQWGNRHIPGTLRPPAAAAAPRRPAGRAAAGANPVNKAGKK
jgi:DNA-binding HxlR family transcriptional regulator